MLEPQADVNLEGRGWAGGGGAVTLRSIFPHPSPWFLILEPNRTFRCRKLDKGWETSRSMDKSYRMPR